MKGFSRSNLSYMRAFAAAWPEQDSIVQRPVGQLPWGHVTELLDKLDDQDLRDWYAAKDAAHGWSRAVLAHQIRKHDKHAPTVGILLVASKNESVVRYALASSPHPVAVSRYELAEDAQAALPDEQAMLNAFARELE